MILLARAAGTWNVPPLIGVSLGAVVIEGVWQFAQPISLEQALACLNSGCDRPARRSFCGSHEVGEGESVDSVVLRLGIIGNRIEPADVAAA